MTPMHSFLQAGASRLGLTVSSDSLQILFNYLELIKKWNARINLVSSLDDREIAAAHIIDSMAPVPHIPATVRRMVDVGSGGGFPGAVIAVLRPEIEVTALEPVRKKHAFLCALVRELNLANFRPQAERMEAHVQRAAFQPYDAAISRATFALSTWMERATLLVHERGLILGMEGAEQSELPEGATRHPYELPTDPPRTRAIIRLQQDARP